MRTRRRSAHAGRRLARGRVLCRGRLGEVFPVRPGRATAGLYSQAGAWGPDVANRRGIGWFSHESAGRSSIFGGGRGPNSPTRPRAYNAFTVGPPNCPRRTPLPPGIPGDRPTSAIERIASGRLSLTQPLPRRRARRGFVRPFRRSPRRVAVGHVTIDPGVFNAGCNEEPDRTAKFPLVDHTGPAAGIRARSALLPQHRRRMPRRSSTRWACES